MGFDLSDPLDRDLRKLGQESVGEEAEDGGFMWLALARILFKKSDLIIIDEGTSALDKNTEELILSSITNLESRPAIILITHNRNNLRYCNKAFEIKEGRLSIIN